MIEYFSRLASYMDERTIAIYGMGKVGEIVFEYLKNDYAIVGVDNKKNEYFSGSWLKDNRCYVIITPLSGYDVLENEINEYGYKEFFDYVCVGKDCQLANLISDKLEFEKYGLYGDYDEYDSALDALKMMYPQYGKGYAEEQIVDSVNIAIQKVRNKQASYERDGFLFYEKSWNTNFLSALLYIREKSLNKSISVVDFGGALGSLFFQHEELLKNVDWYVIEQESFVDVGIKTVPEITFYYSFEDYLQNVNKKDVLVLSGVLVYLDKPYQIIQKIMEIGFEFIFLDRTYFNFENRDRLCLQLVSPDIYKACYPVWLFDRCKFNECFIEGGYEKIIAWNSILENGNGGILPIHQGDEIIKIREEGALFEKK